MCVLVDDMIDTGGTIVKAAEALMADGAAGVIIAATHAILSDPAVDRLKNSPATEIIVTNTLPLADGVRVRQAHLPLDRAADLAGDQGGLRGRLGHQHVRRARLARIRLQHGRFVKIPRLPRRGTDLRDRRGRT